MTTLISALAFPLVLATHAARANRTNVTTAPATPPAVATGKPTGTATATDSAAMTLIVVQNNRSVPVTIFADDDDQQEIGVVAPLSTATISIDRFVFGPTDMHFFAHPAGEIELGTDYITVERGDHIGILVPQR